MVPSSVGISLEESVINLGNPKPFSETEEADGGNADTVSNKVCCCFLKACPGERPALPYQHWLPALYIVSLLNSYHKAARHQLRAQQCMLSTPVSKRAAALVPLPHGPYRDLCGRAWKPIHTSSSVMGPFLKHAVSVRIPRREELCRGWSESLHRRNAI